MTYKFTYITVQHSGTRFLEKYFTHLGFHPLQTASKCRTCGEYHNYMEHIDEPNVNRRIEYGFRHFSNNESIPIKQSPDKVLQERLNPIVCTMRHPHRTAISYLSRGYDLRECLTMWDNLIKFSTTQLLVYYWTDCKEENRKTQLIDLVNSIDCYDNETEELTDKFVLDWKPIGAYNSDIKQEYERTKSLPNVFDWSRFDRAVNWYNKRIEECEY